MPTAFADNFAFSSSVKADVWHPQKDDKSYEWWYFDALSDDGKEAIVIVFLDNFIYSPRYNRETASISGNKRCPAISFTYYRDGKVVYRTVNEFHQSDFHSSETEPRCEIGGSEFKFESASYGSGYSLKIRAAMPGGMRTVEADLEWLSVEADLSPDTFCYEENKHCWNMVSSRSDVSGKISLRDSGGKEIEARSFRGTGYHDHNIDNRWLAKSVQDWHWGRAHFADCTAVFFRFREKGQQEANTRLILVRNGVMEERNVAYQEQNYIRDKFGIRYPSELKLSSEDGVGLKVKPIAVIDSSFYFLRFLSEITIEPTWCEPHTTMGLTEFIAPKTLKYRWLNWLSDVRTGKNGKSSYF
jgi:carotenoid 1,2-hydratase